MATWKKMAEAFGRAMDEYPREGKAAQAILHSKGADWEGKYDRMTPEQRAYKHGQMLEGEENYQVAKERAKEDPSKSITEHIDDIEDENSDYRLRKDFEDAFEEAVARRSGKLVPPKLKESISPETLKKTEEYNEDFVRRKMIEDLQSGKDIGDVLRDYNDLY